MAMLKSLFFFLLSALSVSVLTGQSPVKWTFSSTDLGNDTYLITFTADIEDGWNTYSQHLESDEGPVATSFRITPGDHIELIGSVEEGGDISTAYDAIFAMNLTKIKHKGIFTQKVRQLEKFKPVTGQIEYMVCNGEMCLPPKAVDFSIDLKPKGQRN